MDIGGKIIYTPFDDDPCSPFAPDWMHQVARQLVGCSISLSKYPVLRDIKYLSEYIHVLKSDKVPGTAKTEQYRPYYFAIARNNEARLSEMKPRLDSLLLTNVPYTVICKDLDERMKPEYIRAYEQLFFNCRDTDDVLTKACYRKIRFSKMIN